MLSDLLATEKGDTTPFSLEADVGSYWLTRLKSRGPTTAMAGFRAWFKAAFAEAVAGGGPTLIEVVVDGSV